MPKTCCFFTILGGEQMYVNIHAENLMVLPLFENKKEHL